MQFVFNGIIDGFAVALLGLSFAIVYVPTRVFHIALAGIYTATSATVWLGVNSKWSQIFVSGSALLVAVVISWLCSINHSFLERRKSTNGLRILQRKSINNLSANKPTKNANSHMVASLAIYIILIAITTLGFGNETRLLDNSPSPVSYIGDVVLVWTQLLIAVISIVFLSGFYILLYKSGQGLKLRALANNPKEFALAGFNIKLIYKAVFIVSGVMCGIVAILNTYDRGFSPHNGLNTVLIAVVATIVGGQNSFLGPVVGGLILGVLRTGAAWFINASWQDASVFTVLALFLVLRPQGIINQNSRLGSI